jgi:hypothetical protein
LPDPPGAAASASPMLMVGRAIWPIRTGAITRGRVPRWLKKTRLLGIKLDGLQPLAIDLNRRRDPWSLEQLYRCGRASAMR